MESLLKHHLSTALSTGFDNTLHIVPALALVDKAHGLSACSLYSTTQVTSYIIPFVGPHECPNSKKCPNHSTGLEESTAEPMDQLAENLEQARLQEGEEEEPLGHDLPEHMLVRNSGTEDAVQPLPQQQQTIDTTGNSQVMAASFMASKTCPYPLSVVWWKTNSGQNRAIIGYSDGSICFVGLSPNCPMIASTAIENGSVMRLVICKDKAYDGVMLLVRNYSTNIDFQMIEYGLPSFR